MPLVHHCALVYVSLMQQYLRLVQQVRRCLAIAHWHLVLEASILNKMMARRVRNAALLL